MSSKSLFPRKSSSLKLPASYRSKKLPLRAVLIVPFVLEIAIAVGLTGYLSYRNGQQVATRLVDRLMAEMSEQIDQHLDCYLSQAKQENLSNANTLRMGGFNSKDLPQLGIFFWNQVQTHRFNYVNFRSAKGESIGAGYAKGIWHIADQTQLSGRNTNIYSVDRWGSRAYLFGLDQKASSETNKNLDVGYAAAVKARRQVWTPIRVAPDPFAPISMAVSTPIYDRSDQLVGVTSIDLNLQEIHRFLSNFKASKNATVFVVERSGQLVASSSDEPIYRNVAGALKRRSPSDRWGSLMADATEQVIQRFGSFQAIRTSQRLSFTRDNERQFLQVTPYREDLGLDWVIVVAVPESDVVGGIHSDNHLTLLLCAIALAGAIVLGLHTSHWIASPILRLSKASRDLALGKLDAPVEEGSYIAELEVLAHSFNQMTEHLQKSFDEVTVALQESEEKFTKVFRASPDPIAISTLEGQFLEVNDSFVNVFGYAKAEVIGRTGTEIGLWVNLDDREKLVQALQTQKALCNLEYNFYSRSGEVLTLLFSSEIIELNGQPCILGVAKDITGRKQAEEALRQSEQRFRGAFATSAVGIAITSLEGKILQANLALCEMLGYIESELLELTFQDVTHPDDVEKDLVYTHQLTSGEIPYFHIQKRYLHRDGSILWGFLSVSLVRDRHRQPLYLVAQIQNITDRKRAEAELKAQQALLRQVMDVVPGSLLVKNQEGNFIRIGEANTGFCSTSLEGFSDRDRDNFTH